jgi:hypothetical protein
VRNAHDSESGLTPKIINYAFKKIKDAEKVTPELKFQVNVSYLEIYLNDLLDLVPEEKKQSPTLELIHNGGKPFVKGLKTHTDLSEDEVMGLYKSGRFTSPFFNPFFRDCRENIRPHKDEH